MGSNLSSTVSQSELEAPDYLNQLFEETKEESCVVKLYICNIIDFPDDLVRLYDTLGISKFGIFHAGLQIGNYLFDYMADSRVRVRSLVGQSSFLCFTLKCQQITKTVRENIVKVIKYWNGRPYNTTFSNCHHFNFALLEALGISDLDKILSPTIYQLLEDLKCNENKIVFRPKYSGKEFVFESHQEVENFEYQRKELKLTPEEEKLLKGIHRSFQLREHVCGDRRLSCVFGDLTKLERQYLNEKK